MYFLVQENIYADPDHYKIFKVLEELKIEYDKINLTYDTKDINLNINRNDIFVYGSVTLARLAKKRTDWYPGSFYGGNHLYEVYSRYYTTNLVNYPVEIHKIKDQLDWKSDEKKFIKPYLDAKVFTGKAFSETEWTDFIYESLHNTYTKLQEDTLILVSESTTLLKEARIWVIGSQIIDSGYYRFNENILYEDKVSEDGLSFAKNMIDLYQPEEAFVLDIGLTYNGWKIVEINCINSSGFYPNTNVKAIIKALNIYFSTTKKEN
ncbi:ATP-grasp domain-containing protein [Apibacter raozihei]|uniref:ATP-grasp domain-containing protein n=1 Tax=Apibacter raozihei TaxID=2500547 RepID=UPI000FE2E386|nr:ATP-grasp domain-containing protein [Apibacter raozihei]